MFPPCFDLAAITTFLGGICFKISHRNLSDLQLNLLYPGISVQRYFEEEHGHIRGDHVLIIPCRGYSTDQYVGTTLLLRKGCDGVVVEAGV